MTSAPVDDPGTLRRRRALELALDRRPDMTLGDLHRVLVALDMETDTPTLVADLDALGFDVADAEAPAPEPEEVDPEAVRAAVDAATGAPRSTPGPLDLASGAARSPAVPATPEPASSGGLPWWQTRTGVAIAAGALLLACLAIAAGLAARDDDPDASALVDEVATTVGTLPPVASSTAPLPTGPVETAPTGPGADPALAEGVDGVTGFDAAADADLGPAPDGGPWDLLAGTWSGADGVARLDAVDGEEGVGLAVFDPGLDAYRLQVGLASLVTANGLVFGVADAGTYHALVAAPDFSTFVLVRVVDGQRQIIRNSALTTTAPDAAVIGVHVTPEAVEVLVEGAVVFTHPLDVPLAGTAMGIGSTPGGFGGTFDEVSFRADV